MKGYRFYAEMDENRGSKSGTKQQLPFTRKTLTSLANAGYHCNVVAVPLDEKGRPLWQGRMLVMDAFAAVSGRINGPVEGTAVELGYLRNRCVRIGADLARRLHPALFNYLEAP